MNCGRVEFVDEDAINDSLTHLVVVLRLGLDILRVCAKRLAALALGGVLAIVYLSPKLLPECYRTNQPNSNPFASSQLAAPRARSLPRMARFYYSLGGCFLASMPDSFVSSRQKTLIKAIRLFRVHTNSKALAISEKSQKFRDIGDETCGTCERTTLPASLWPQV